MMDMTDCDKHSSVIVVETYLLCNLLDICFCGDVLIHLTLNPKIVKFIP